jgi:hypothetical protein
MQSTVPKCWADKGWVDVCSDICWEEHGGLWGKRLRPHVWLFVKFDILPDGGEACADVRLVNLNEVTGKSLQDAAKSCGMDDLGIRPRSAMELESELAYCCVSYGIAAPLSERMGRRPDRVRADAFRSAEEYAADEAMMDSALDRTVNAIGSTARDFMQGNSLAGLDRYAMSVVETGKAEDDGNNLMLGLYGVDVERLKEGDLGVRAKQVKQGDLSSECWSVQIWGTTYCRNCEWFGKPDCGGQDILKTGANTKGVKVGKLGI